MCHGTLTFYTTNWTSLFSRLRRDSLTTIRLSTSYLSSIGPLFHCRQVSDTVLSCVRFLNFHPVTLISPLVSPFPSRSSPTSTPVLSPTRPRSRILVISVTSQNSYPSCTNLNTKMRPMIPRLFLYTTLCSDLPHTQVDTFPNLLSSSLN